MSASLRAGIVTDVEAETVEGIDRLSSFSSFTVKSLEFIATVYKVPLWSEAEQRG